MASGARLLIIFCVLGIFIDFFSNLYSLFSMKIIFVTGGIISGLGKGVTASSIGRLLKSSGYSINMMKIDPYLQVDAGTMSPYEHGEVFVTEDGAETDLDVGNYERFVDIELNKESNPTTGKIYLTVIENERRGDYLGKTVQVIPHITDDIKRRITGQAAKADICIVEIGGLVGDAESPVFIEAIRQIRKDIGKENVCYVHVVPLLYIDVSGEFKTKAIQLSTRQLREAGIQPDILVSRCPKPMPQELKPKISMFTDVDESNIIEAVDARTIYEVPLLFQKQGLKEIIEDTLHLEHRATDLTDWQKFVDNIVSPEKEIHIAIVGKYAELEDAYMSVREALVHAGAAYATKVRRHWINAEEVEANPGLLTSLREKWELDGVIIPGWFGSRGIEWKIATIKYVRENNIPFLGICLWLQLSVIEFARNVCWVTDATSTEFEKPGTAFIDYLPDQNESIAKGGTLRLGHQEATIIEGSLIHQLYGSTTISDRHRHRYEVSPDKHEILRSNGLVLSGTSHEGRLVEYIENPACTYFVATQAHPEFKSRPGKPHPLFDGLVKACL
jgi:CTP synthase